MAADKQEIDPRHDLAAYEVVGSTPAPFQLWAGEAQQITDAGLSVGVLPKYTLAALIAADNTLVAFVPGTHDPKQMVVTAQPATGAGQNIPYWVTGKFNHEAINFPAAWDTYLERKNLIMGSRLDIGHLNY